MKKTTSLLFAFLMTPLLSAKPDSPNQNLSPREQQIVAAAEPGKDLIKNDNPYHLALTPPMGWNSFDAFNDSVTEAQTMENAEYIAKNMKGLGWNTVVIDFRWYDPNTIRPRVPTINTSIIDANGRHIPAVNRFPSSAGGKGFKPIADKIHALGLKFGIHVMRGIPRRSVTEKTPILGSDKTAGDAGNPKDNCTWNGDMHGVPKSPAGQAWYDSLAKQWAEWGMDFVKIDDLTNPYNADEVEMIRIALDRHAPKIVFSTSPGPTPSSEKEATHVRPRARMWRVSFDVWDRWDLVDQHFAFAKAWAGQVGPGRWPDGDMLPLGRIKVLGFGDNDAHYTHLTREEQLSLMSFWCLRPTPLIAGNNLPDNDAWFLALYTNPEVIALNQDPLGVAALEQEAGLPAGVELWTRRVIGNKNVVGIFNRTNKPVKVTLDWEKLGFARTPKVRDLWIRKDLPESAQFTDELPRHGSLLLRVE